MSPSNAPYTEGIVIEFYGLVAILVYCARMGSDTRRSILFARLKP